MDKRFKVKTNFCICEMIAGVEKFLSLSEACKILNALDRENRRLKKEKHDIIQTVLNYWNNDFNGHRDSFECLLDDIGWFDEAWLDNDGNIRPIEDLEKIQEEHE